MNRKKGAVFKQVDACALMKDAMLTGIHYTGIDKKVLMSSAAGLMLRVS